jgi:hypothetical protein
MVGEAMGGSDLGNKHNGDVAGIVPGGASPCSAYDAYFLYHRIAHHTASQNSIPLPL